MNSYKKLLKVRTPEGKKIFANVQSTGVKVLIKVQGIKAVEVDKPSFAKNGEIRICIDKSNYKEAIEKITKYLEHLFLKKMSQDENKKSEAVSDESGNTDKNSSDESKAKSAGNIKQYPRKEIAGDKGKRRFAGISDREGRDKSTESIRGKQE